MSVLRDLVNRWRESASNMNAPPLVREAWFKAADDLVEALNVMDEQSIPLGLCERSSRTPFFSRNSKGAECNIVIERGEVESVDGVPVAKDEEAKS